MVGRIWILTLWEDEPGEEYGWRGEVVQPLFLVCNIIWGDRLIRLGHARTVYPRPPLNDPAWQWRSRHWPPYKVDAIEAGWERYAVYLRDGDGQKGRKLDLDRTLAENGLTGDTWVWFERED